MLLLRQQYARDVTSGATRELEVDRAKLEGSPRMAGARYSARFLAF